MSTKKATIITCDVCKKQETDDGEVRIGGGIFQGWFVIQQKNFSSSTRELGKKRNWDICSEECLLKFARTVHKYQELSNGIIG